MVCKSRHSKDIVQLFRILGERGLESKNNMIGIYFTVHLGFVASFHNGKTRRSFLLLTYLLMQSKLPDSTAFSTKVPVFKCGFCNPVKWFLNCLINVTLEIKLMQFVCVKSVCTWPVQKCMLSCIVCSKSAQKQFELWVSELNYPLALIIFTGKYW